MGKQRQKKNTSALLWKKARQVRKKLRKRKWNLPIEVRLVHGFTEHENDLARDNNRLHRAIRRLILKISETRCSACGYMPANPRELDAHEIFILNSPKRIRKFVTYRLLCKKCHRLTHYAYFSFIRFYIPLLRSEVEKTTTSLDEEVKRTPTLWNELEYFCQVNKCTPLEACIYAEIVDTVQTRLNNNWKLNRSPSHWNTDWNSLRQYRGKLGNNNATLEKMLSENRLRQASNG